MNDHYLASSSPSSSSGVVSASTTSTSQPSAFSTKLIGSRSSSPRSDSTSNFLTAPGESASNSNKPSSSTVSMIFAQHHPPHSHHPHQQLPDQRLNSLNGPAGSSGIVDESFIFGSHLNNGHIFVSPSSIQPHRQPVLAPPSNIYVSYAPTSLSVHQSLVVAESSSPHLAHQPPHHQHSQHHHLHQFTSPGYHQPPNSQVLNPNHGQTFMPPNDLIQPHHSHQQYGFPGTIMAPGKENNSSSSMHLMPSQQHQQSPHLTLDSMISHGPAERRVHFAVDASFLGPSYHSPTTAPIVSSTTNQLDNGGNADGSNSAPQNSTEVRRPRSVKRRVSANRKERRRTQSINGAFSALRGCIPNVPNDTKLSKIKTLKLATSYIGYLRSLLAGEPSSSPLKGSSIVEVLCSSSNSNKKSPSKAQLASLDNASSGHKFAPPPSNQWTPDCVIANNDQKLRNVNNGSPGAASGQRRRRSGWPHVVWAQSSSSGPSGSKAAKAHKKHRNAPSALSLVS